MPANALPAPTAPAALAGAAPGPGRRAAILLPGLRGLAGMCLLLAFWGAGILVARLLHLPAPGSVVGLALLLGALAAGLVPLAWLEPAADGLLRHMLLFFVPAAVGVIDHPQLLGGPGLRAVGVVAVSTALVMAATGGVVEWLARRRGARP